MAGMHRNHSSGTPSSDLPWHDDCLFVEVLIPAPYNISPTGLVEKNVLWPPVNRTSQHVGALPFMQLRCAFQETLSGVMYEGEKREVLLSFDLDDDLSL